MSAVVRSSVIRSPVIRASRIDQQLPVGLRRGLVFAPDMGDLVDVVTGQRGAPTGTSWIPGSNARDFDGTDDRVVYNGPFSGAAGLSFAAWVYHDTDSTTDVYFEVQSTIGAAIVFSRRATDSIRLTWTGTATLDVHSDNLTAPAAGAWSHVAVAGSTATATNWRLYVAGSEVSGYQTQTNGSGLRNPNDELTIGALLAGTDPLDGKIGEPRFWNRTLSAAEIAALAAMPRPG